MKISARIDNSFRKNVVTLDTDGAARELPIPQKADGPLALEATEANEAGR